MSPLPDKIIDLEAVRGRPRVVPGHGGYCLAEPYTFGYLRHIWTVPAGYTYDGASIPTLTGLTWVVTYSKFDPVVMRAALEHDYFCDLRPPAVSSREAAARFLATLIEDGADLRKARLMHRAVLAFGPKWGTA